MWGVFCACWFVCLFVVCFAVCWACKLVMLVEWLAGVWCVLMFWYVVVSCECVHVCMCCVFGCGLCMCG